MAKELAGSIINNRLGACVNILPGYLLNHSMVHKTAQLHGNVSSCTPHLLLLGVTSVYQWRGRAEEFEKQLLIIKTQTSLIDQLTKHVQANHPYDECEVISMPVTGGSSSYLSWIVKSTGQGSELMCWLLVCLFACLCCLFVAVHVAVPDVQ